MNSINGFEDLIPSAAERITRYEGYMARLRGAFDRPDLSDKWLATDEDLTEHIVTYIGIYVKAQRAEDRWFKLKRPRR